MRSTLRYYFGGAVGTIFLHYSSSSSRLRRVCITAHIGFDLAVGLALHLHLVTLYNHNTTTIQGALSTALGGAIEHYKTRSPFFHALV